MTVYDAIRALGGTHVVAPFSGGNDEGGFDGDAQLFNDTEVIREFDVYDESSRQTYDAKLRKFVPKETTNPTLQLVATVLSETLGAKYGSFAGEFRVDGTVTVDARTNLTEIHGQEETSSWREF